MKHFLRLIEVANADGIVVKHPYNKMKIEPMSAHDAKAFRECQPIVFGWKNEEPMDLEEWEDVKDFGPLERTFDSPFKTFSYEMVTGSITTPRPTDRIKVHTWCVVATEVAPGNWGFYGLMENEEDDGLYVVATNSFGPLTEEFIKRINTEKVGYETSRHNIKIGTGKIKQHRRIRRIVHVHTKSYVKKNEGSSEIRHINFTHRFLVRGHWRKLEMPTSLGKNRDGDYVVNGKTWVTESEKGQGPLITKTRLVE